MPSIKISNIEEPSSGKDYKYSDITLDFGLNIKEGAGGLNIKKTSDDIQMSKDELAIKNALVNLFNTTPGEKVLNPEFGLNLKRYLFEPLTDLTARIIGETIYEGISKYEPRVRIINIGVVKDIDNQQFDITISIAIPKLSNRKVSFKGTLTKEQFTSTNEQ